MSDIYTSIIITSKYKDKIIASAFFTNVVVVAIAGYLAPVIILAITDNEPNSLN